MFSFFVVLFLLLFPVCATAAEKAPPAAPSAEKIHINSTVYGVLRTNHALQGMQENRAVLENELARAKRFGFGPRVDVTGRAGVGRLSDPTTRAQDKTNTRSVTGISATLTQPIWDLGAWSRAREAEETLASVRSRVIDSASSVALDGILAHLDVLRRQSIYDSTVKNVNNIKSILKQSEDRAAMGADTQADVSQARSRLSRALSSLAESKAALRVAKDTYTRLTGISDYGLAPVEAKVFKYADQDEVFDLAKKKNPRLAAYLSDVRTRRAARVTSRAAFLPVITLEAGPNYTNRGRHSGDENYVSSFDVVGVMRWNAFSSGADLAADKAGAARIRQARKELLDYCDEVKLAIDNAWTNMNADHEQFELYSQAVKHNQYTRQAYWQQFRVGSRSLLDVLDSENELYNSTVQAENAFVSSQANSYRLYALAGELFETLEVDVDLLDNLPPEESPLPGEE
jgi:adhesin transport system outer membrane protein